MPKYSINIAASLDNLNVIRSFIIEKLRKFDKLSEKQINEIVLAADEYCANIVKHSYNFDDSREIEIELSYSPTTVIVEVRDDGPPFDLAKFKISPAETPKKRKKNGGWGIALIKSIADEIRYRPKTSSASKNSIKLIKKLK